MRFLQRPSLIKQWLLYFNISYLDYHSTKLDTYLHYFLFIHLLEHNISTSRYFINLVHHHILVPLTLKDAE